MEIINGDVLSTTCIYIAHQCNAMGKMNSGVAKQIREKYPEVFERYKEFLEVNEFLGGEILGTYVSVQCSDGHIILNIIGQYGYGYDGHQYTNYNALRRGFVSAIMNIRAADHIPFDCQFCIALPYCIGSDRGGGDWNIVKQILEDIEKKQNVLFLAYKL